MGLGTIPTRANSTNIDSTWFDIINTALSTDFVPRAVGVVTDLAGNLGQAAIRWSTAYVNTLVFGDSTNSVTLRTSGSMTAPYTLLFPGGVPATVNEAIATDSTGVLDFSKMPGDNQVVGSSCGNFSTSSTSPVGMGLSTDITTTGGDVEIRLVPDGSTNEAYSTTLNYQIIRDGNVIAELKQPTVGSGSSHIKNFYFIDGNAAAGAHNYNVLGYVTSGSGQLEYVALNLRER